MTHNKKMVSSERLIEIVKRYPSLYDEVHPDFGDKSLNAKLWNKIGLIFHTNGATVQDVWMKSKKSYLRHLKEDPKYKFQFSKGYNFMRWLKSMEYFKPFFQFNDSLAANIKQIKKYPLLGNSDSSDVSTTISEELNLKPKRQKKKNRKDQYSQTNIISCNQPENQPQELRNEADNSMKASKENRQGDLGDDHPSNRTINLENTKPCYLDACSCRSVMDAMELTFLGYAKTVKSFSPMRQTYTKMKIAQIIMEQEIQHLDERSESKLHFVPDSRNKDQICNWNGNYATKETGKERTPSRYNDIGIIKLM